MPHASDALGFDVAPSVSINCPRVARGRVFRVLLGVSLNRIGGVPGKRQQQRQESSYRPVIFSSFSRASLLCPWFYLIQSLDIHVMMFEAPCKLVECLLPPRYWRHFRPEASRRKTTDARYYGGSVLWTKHS